MAFPEGAQENLKSEPPQSAIALTKVTSALFKISGPISDLIAEPPEAGAVQKLTIAKGRKVAGLAPRWRNPNFNSQLPISRLLAANPLNHTPKIFRWEALTRNKTRIPSTPF